MLLVAAEPFEEPLIVSLEGPLTNIERRLGHDFMVTKMWYELEKDVAMEKSVSGVGNLHLGICLEGG